MSGVMVLIQVHTNKCIMVGILLAGKALLKSPYAKRYASTESNSTFNTDRYTTKEDRVYVEDKS